MAQKKTTKNVRIFITEQERDGIMKNDDEISSLNQELNQLAKKLDNVYYQLAKSSGLSDAAFLIIYTIRNEGETYKQKDICTLYSYSKQTINSALKKLEEHNIIKLVSVSGNKKDKKITLTEYGEKIAKELIEPVAKIEKNSLNKLKERDKLVELLKEYVEEMEKETEQFLNNDNS